MKKAYLLLEDSSIWEGFSFGARGSVSGEVVFTTGMVGYPQAMTDPSYAGQIVVFTYPLQGNYGVPVHSSKKNLSSMFESDRIHANAMVVSSAVSQYSHWQATQSLDNWLKTQKLPGIYGIDTRALTKRLRKQGVMLGKISSYLTVPKNWRDPIATNLVATVSTTQLYRYGRGPLTVLLVDCGVKHSMIHELLALGVRVIRVPWDIEPDGIQEPYDAVVVSNGPGDPTTVDKTVQFVRYCLDKNIPLLGVCLGNQILALAAGGKTFKLPYGHRSHNQPSLDRFTHRAYMTTQNHGFSVDMRSLDNQWEEWFVNLNDGTNEGLRHKHKPFWSVQFHPEGAPGPADTRWIFRDFLAMVEKKVKSLSNSAGRQISNSK